MDEVEIDLIREINERLERVIQLQKKIDSEFQVILRRQADLQKEWARG